MNDDPFIDPETLRLANQQHDAEHGPIDRFAQSRIRCGWHSNTGLLRGELTDRQIEKYAQRGFYDADFKEARKLHNERSKKRRSGNFQTAPDGRLIYRPV